MSLDEKALGQRLATARRQAGLTQQDLCQKAGLSYSTLAKIERGAIKSPSVFTVAAIATATANSLEDLLGLKSASPAPPAKKISKSGIRFVYFDVNGVLVRFFYRAFPAIAAEAHVSPDEVETLFWRHNDAVNRGDMNLKDFNNLFKKEFGLGSFDWQKHYMAAIEPMPGIDELVKWTAEHYEVGLLSNNMPGFLDELIKSHRVPSVGYKAVVDSSKVNAIKPEAKIYKLAQATAGVESNEILLIDDGRTNLMAADKAGWRVLWFDDYRPSEGIKRSRESLVF